MKWFKFYGQDWLSDPKTLALSASERSCWMTLLSYASVNDNGIVKFLDEQQLMTQAGVSSMHEEWEYTTGVLEKLKNLKMITIDNGIITILNWGKRQETSLTGYQRVKRYREKHRNDNNDNETDNAMITSDKNRIDKNRIEDNKSANADTLVYEKPLKETFDNKKKTYEKLGIPYVAKKKTSAQDLAWQTETLARYIQDKAMELLRVDVYINKKESGKGWQSLKRAVKEFGLDKCKAHCDKYLISEKCEKFGADVSVMFSEHSINMPTAKKKKEWYE